MSLRVLPGRVAVLWPLGDEGLIVAPQRVRRARVFSSGFPGIRDGDSVAVRADAACLSLNRSDYDFVPEGHEVRIYGVHEAVLNDEEDVVFGIVH
jgi:hypothetical protein